MEKQQERKKKDPEHVPLAECIICGQPDMQHECVECGEPVHGPVMGCSDFIETAGGEMIYVCNDAGCKEKYRLRQILDPTMQPAATQ